MKRCALFFVIYTVFATTAAAQQPPPGPPSKTGDPRKDARIHLGPFYMTPVILVNNVGIDGNVFNAAGEQKSDFTISAAPKVTVWTPVSKRALITTELTEGVTYYKIFSNQSSLDPGVSVAADLDLRRITVFGTQSYSQSRQRPNFEIDVRVPLTSSGTTAGFSIKLGARTRVGASASRSHFRYGKNAVFLGTGLSERLNRAQQGVQVQLERQLTPLTSVRLLVENRQDRFEFSPDRDANGHRVMAGATFGQRALISGEASIGFRRMEFVNASVLPFGGAVAQVALNYKRQAATTYRVEWNRDVEFSFEALNPYYLLNGTKLAIRRQVAGRFDGILLFGRNNISYGKVVSSEISRRAVTKALSFDLGYRLTRDTRLGFAIVRDWRTSKPSTGRDYSGIRAGLSFGVGF